MGQVGETLESMPLGKAGGVRRKGVDESTELAQLLDDLLERECVAGKMKHLLDWN